MKQDKIALKTLGIKATLANQIRKDLYKKKVEDFTSAEKEKLFEEWFKLNHRMHWDLLWYKSKRQDKAKLLKKRQEAPQTRSMMKKLGLIKKVKKNLES